MLFAIIPENEKFSNSLIRDKKESVVRATRIVEGYLDFFRSRIIELENSTVRDYPRNQKIL